METRILSNHNITKEAVSAKEKRFIDKVKDHKKEIAIGAVTILSVVAIVLVVKNKATIKAAIKSTHIEGVLANSLETKNNVIQIISQAIPVSIPDNPPIVATNVRGHIRNLPEGWKPSINKIESAGKLGYCIDEHQTWVNAYVKVAA